MFALGLAACTSAEAQSNETPARSGIPTPPGWHDLPAVASAARHALGEGLEIEGTQAWGEPARGCYAVWIAIRGGGTAQTIATDVVNGLTAAGGGTVLVTDVVRPSTDEGVLTFGFTRPPFRGKLAAKLGGGRVAALACFANAREPAWCATGCTSLLGAIP